ncbi:MAG: hypothetical protein PVF68_10175 [Acidobacteriota bacterium]|jgi:hypothetical protein
MRPQTSSSEFDRGRDDPRGILADRLARAPADYLEGALRNPALDEDLVVLMLRNRAAPGALIERIARDERYRGSHEVRAGLVSHPASPRGVAMNLVHLLYWRDLARAADDPRVPPPVRRVAVRVLESRMEEMTLGERIALARAAGRSVILALRRSREPRVVEALLDNPRIVEEDAVFLASRTDVPADVLGALARSRRWSPRYPVRLALVHNERSPVGIVLGLLTGLLRRDLEGLLVSHGGPPVIRFAAERVLRARAGARGRRAL